MKKILGVLLCVGMAISNTVMANGKVAPSTRPYALPTQHDTTQVLLITDRPGNMQYLTTLGNKGGRAQSIFGSSRGRAGGARPATWYTHDVPSGLSVEGISGLAPAGFFSAMADIGGNRTPLQGAAYGQRNNPVLSAAALNALAHAPLGSRQRFSFRETLSNGQVVQVVNDVTKGAQLTLSSPGRPYCKPGNVAGKQGYVCRLRKIDLTSTTRDGGDIFFSLRTGMRMPDARYRVGGDWLTVNSVTPVSALAQTGYIEFFFVPPQKPDAMALAGRVLEMTFFSRSRQARGDRIRLAVSGRELGLDKSGLTATRLKLLTVDDKVSGVRYLTTQGESTRQRIFGTSDQALQWRLAQGQQRQGTVTSLNPPSYFSTRLRPLDKGALLFSASGSAKLFSLAPGQQQLLRAGGTDVDNSKFMLLTSAAAQSRIELSQADDPACRPLTVDNERGLGCTVRRYVMQGGVDGNQLRFGIAGLAGAKYKVNTRWHAFNDDIPVSEFAKTGRIEVFIPASKGEAKSGPRFKAEFYSTADKARGDRFVVKLTKLSSQLEGVGERQRQLDIMMVDDAVTDTHYITTLSSNTLQSVYGDQSTARWYPLGRIKRAKDANPDAIEKQVSLKRVEPGQFFTLGGGGDRNALFQGVPLSAQAWSALNGAEVGQRFPFSYVMQGKGKEWRVTQTVSKQATLQLDAAVGISCRPGKVAGVKGTICPLRVVTLKGGIPDNTLSLAIQGGAKRARYRFNGSVWLAPEQALQLRGTKEQSGVLDMFMPSDKQGEQGRQDGTRMPTLALYNQPQRQGVFIRLLSGEKAESFSGYLAGSTDGMFGSGYAPPLPVLQHFLFSEPTSPGMTLGPSLNHMHINYDGEQVLQSEVEITFTPSGITKKLGLSTMDNRIDVPPYSSSMNVVLMPTNLSSKLSQSENISSGYVLYSRAGEKLTMLPMDYNILLNDRHSSEADTGQLENFESLSDVIIPGKKFYIGYGTSSLVGGEMQYYRLLCGSGNMAQATYVGPTFTVRNEDGSVFGSAEFGQYVGQANKPVYALDASKKYYIDIQTTTVAKEGDQLNISCIAAPYNNGFYRTSTSAVRNRFSSGYAYLYGVDSPTAAMAAIKTQQTVVITGAEDRDINFQYRFAFSDGSDVSALLSSATAINSYSGQTYPLHDAEGAIPLNKAVSNSFKMQFVASPAAVGKTLNTTYWLDSEPDKVFTNSIEITEGMYLNDAATVAPDSITYGTQGTWSFRLNRAVTAEDSGAFSLKLALQHSGNSSETAVVGTQVDPLVTLKYLPGGSTESVDATGPSTLAPPIGTTTIEATATALTGNIADTTLGMRAETFYLKGLNGIEATSSVTKSTKLINFGLTSVTDGMAKEGELVTQTLAYTESKADDNGFYLRYRPATAEHPVDDDDYDLSQVSLLFSDGSTQMVDLSGTVIPKIIVPEGSSSVAVSLPVTNDNVNEWSDEKGLLQASLADDFADPVEGTFTISNVLAPSVFDITLEAPDGSTASGNFSDSEPATVAMVLTRTESNAPKPDQEMAVEKYLARRMTDTVVTTASLLGNSASISGKTSCAFALNGSTSVTVPMRAQLRYNNADGAPVVSAQDCSGSTPVNVDEGEWVLQSKDDDTGIEVRQLTLNAEFPLDDSFSAFNSEHKGWEGIVKGSGTVRVDIRFPAP